jgi:hypothetical protein
MAVGEAIRRRMRDELLLTKAELIRASGISDKTLAGYLAGKPVRRDDKRRDLCAALGWTPDSIDRVLDGQPPLTLINAWREARAAYQAALNAGVRSDDPPLLSAGELSALKDREADAQRALRAHTRLNDDIAEAGRLERVLTEDESLDAMAVDLAPDQRAQVQAYIQGLIDAGRVRPTGRFSPPMGHDPDGSA